MTGAGELVAGRYRITGALGVGGLGRVWLAVDEMLDRQVAIKKCATPQELTRDETVLLRGWMLREARAAGRVSHPNVVAIYDVVPAPDQPWIVMEYVPSRSLLQMIEEYGPLPMERVCEIGVALLDALEAAARVGVLHLDVKPGNVLIADDGRVVLTGFGPAATDQGIAALAQSGMMLGSPNYIAPERLFDGVATTQADLWSVGATLYHAVEGRPPYTRGTPAATMRALADSPPDPADRAGPLLTVLDGLLQRDPSARMTSVEARSRLRLLADGPAVPVPAVPAEPHRAPVRSRRRSVAMVCAVIAVLVALTADTGRLPWMAADPPAAKAQLVRPDPFVLPSRFRWYSDGSGYRVAVPSGWANSGDGRRAVAFWAPGGQPTLRISAWTAGAQSVVSALVSRERTVTLPAYRRVRIEALPESTDAVWEYTYHGPDGKPVRGLDRVMRLGGRAYLIEWRAPRSAWVPNVQKLAVVLDSFRPA